MYQWTVVEKHEVLNKQRVSRALWLATRPAIKGAVLPQAWKLSVSFVRGLFKSGSFYSMPKHMFDRIVAQGDLDYQLDPSIKLLEAIQSISIDYDFGDAASSQFFTVINSNAELRKSVQIGHIAKDTCSIAVSLCALVATKSAIGQVIVHPLAEKPCKLSLKHFVAEIADCLQSTYLWCSFGNASAKVERARPATNGILEDRYEMPPIVGSCRVNRQLHLVVHLCLLFHMAVISVIDRRRSSF